MTSKKGIFDFFANMGIYLPTYQLELVYNEVIERVRNKESIFSICYDLETRTEFNKYKNHHQGAFVTVKEREATKRPIIRVGKDGSEKSYDSIYAAAKDLGKSKDACGNISKAAKGRYSTVYGYTWRWSK
jgi:hypothetical protein